MVYCERDFGKENTITVSLPPDVESYLQGQVAAGFYSSMSEALIEAVRLLQDRNEFETENLETLRAEIAKGEADFERGDYVEYKDAADFLRKIEEGGRKILAKRREAKA